MSVFGGALFAYASFAPARANRLPHLAIAWLLLHVWCVFAGGYCDEFVAFWMYFMQPMSVLEGAMVGRGLSCTTHGAWCMHHPWCMVHDVLCVFFCTCIAAILLVY
jgi:hypothetical protein